MGGPYIPLETVQKVLERMLKKDQTFYGKIELECENGQVYRINRHETMKRAEVEKFLAS